MRPKISEHVGHELRRGPMISYLGDTWWVCITCELVGIDLRNKGHAMDLPRWTDEDYEANREWVEQL